MHFFSHTKIINPELYELWVVNRRRKTDDCTTGRNINCCLPQQVWKNMKCTVLWSSFFKYSKVFHIKSWGTFLEGQTVSAEGRGIKKTCGPNNWWYRRPVSAQQRADHLIGHKSADSSDCCSQVLIQVCCQLADSLYTAALWPGLRECVIQCVCYYLEKSLFVFAVWQNTVRTNTPT